MDAADRATRPSDPVVDAYKKDVDRTLLERNLRLTPTERLEQLQRFVAFLAEAHDAGRRHREGLDDHSTD